MARLGICVDHVGWWRRYEEFAEAAGIPFEHIDIERHDWLQKARAFDIILWRPNLDPPFCEEAKEKIYLLERVLGKRVYPNWSTFWHYDNKRAQAYLFDIHGIPTPRTIVSFDPEEAELLAREIPLPIVAKCSTGAASSSVHLVRSRRQALREVRRAFHRPLWTKVLERWGVRVRPTPFSQNRYVLWQEFCAENPRDLRITVIGCRYAFAFWRNNRPGDFRASGSGRIDYQVDDPTSEIRLCLDICRKLDLDVMAFDLLFDHGQSVISEMSYAFNDSAIFNAPGHYAVGPEDQLHFQSTHVWPQELIVRDVLERLVPHLRDGAPRLPE
jgi:glutathione synthase/RimK-type ligase-like ATP-grasp enzyme